MQVKVVDSIMGSGKTSAIIEMMNQDTDRKFIYITPFLSEVERVKKECTNRKFYEPQILSSRKGQNVRTKFDSFHQLLKEGKNIVSTHSLFQRSNKETKNLIEWGNYTLILDEVMDVIEEVPIKKNDIETLITSNLIEVKEGFINWIGDEESDTRYNDIKDMAMNHSLIMFKNSVLFWSFPASVFEAFDEVYVLTYLFNAQVQKYYYDLFDIQYSLHYATKENEKFVIKEGRDESEKDKRALLKNLISIYDGKLNKIGDKRTALSKSWYNTNRNILKPLKDNTYNYFMNIIKSKSEEIMWTTFKEFQSTVKNKGYTKGFVPCNARATNEFGNKKSLAYLLNKFPKPIIKSFFNTQNIQIDEEAYALSEMLQWIWRSAIRKDEKIDIYIPSKRMRDLLIEWLNE